MNVKFFDRDLSEGRQEGLLKGNLETNLELRFGDAESAVMDRLRGIEDIAALESLAARLRAATTLEEFEREIG